MEEMHSLSLRQQIREIFHQQALAVLATQDNGQPHASLVGFAATEDLTSLIFVTPRKTRKFRNLLTEPRVALLVDTRQHQTADFQDAAAVTAYGRAAEVTTSIKQAFLELFLSRHPHLHDFATSPTSALIEVSVEKYALVSQFQKVQELIVRN